MAKSPARSYPFEQTSRAPFQFPNHTVRASNVVVFTPQELADCQRVQATLEDSEGPQPKGHAFVLASYALCKLLDSTEAAEGWLAQQGATPYAQLSLRGIQVASSTLHEGLRIPVNGRASRDDEEQLLGNVLSPWALVWVDHQKAAAAFVGWLFQFEAARHTETKGSRPEYRIPPDRLCTIDSLIAWYASNGDQAVPGRQV